MLRGRLLAREAAAQAKKDFIENPPDRKRAATLSQYNAQWSRKGLLRSSAPLVLRVGSSSRDLADRPSLLPPKNKRAKVFLICIVICYYILIIFKDIDS